jgi:peroxiredoxin
MRKFKWLIILCLASHLANAQAGNYEIEGTLNPRHNAAKIYMSPLSILGRGLGYQEIIDSAVVVNGHFQLTGTIDHPRYVMLSLVMTEAPAKRGVPDRNNNLGMFLTTGATTILEDSIFSRSLVTGGTLNEEYKVLISMSGHYDSILRPLHEHYYKALHHADIPVMKHYNDSLNTVKLQRMQAFAQFIGAHNNSPVAILAASLLPEPGNIDTLFAPALANSPDGLTYSQNKEAHLPRLKTGEKVPGFTLPGADGKTVSLSDYAGKYVLIDFWASWCGPCRNELPFMKKLYAMTKGSSFQLLPVSVDAKKEDWMKAISEEQISSWTNISDLKGTKGTVPGLYGVQSIPHNFLVGPDGRLLAENVHGTALLEMLAKYLPVNDK